MGIRARGGVVMIPTEVYRRAWGIPLLLRHNGAMKGHGPADPELSPRFAGISTFLRLPHIVDPTGVDAAVVGLPFDAGSTYRSGARFGPRAIREGSLTLRPFYNPAQRVSVFERLSVVDLGDVPVAPMFTERSYERMRETLSRVHEAGAVPIGLGGDHGVLLPELRAAAGRHGPLAILLFDAHTDTADESFGERYTHSTALRRAVEEGLVDPARSTLMGMRGGMYQPEEYDADREMGFLVFPWEELAQLGTGAVTAAVDRAAGKAFLSFDIDFVDPAFAPGTGTPEVGGPSSMQALALVRAARGAQLVGADVVEVLPDLDHSAITSTLAATIAFEILSLLACAAPGEPKPEVSA
jgi:agmatinase